MPVLPPLINELESLDEIMRSMGIESVVIVRGSGDYLAQKLLKEASDRNTDLKNVVVLASETTVTSEKFEPRRSVKGEKRAFLAGVDPTLLSKNKDHPEIQIIDILKMLSLALELAIY